MGVLRSPKGKKYTNEELDRYIVSRSDDLKGDKGRIFRSISNQTWFRQYAKKSKENLKKISDKVIKGIRHGKYTYLSKELDLEDKDFVMPKKKKPVTKKKKPVTKKKKPVTRKKKPVAKTPVIKQPKKKNVTTPKEKSDKNRSYSPETKKRVESARQKYPDASNYELRHGVNSKASQQYRIRNNRPQKYEGRIIG